MFTHKGSEWGKAERWIVWHVDSPSSNGPFFLIHPTVASIHLSFSTDAFFFCIIMSEGPAPPLNVHDSLMYLSLYLSSFLFKIKYLPSRCLSGDKDTSFFNFVYYQHKHFDHYCHLLTFYMKSLPSSIFASFPLPKNLVPICCIFFATLSFSAAKFSSSFLNRNHFSLQVSFTLLNVLLLYVLFFLHLIEAYPHTCPLQFFPRLCRVLLFSAYRACASSHLRWKSSWCFFSTCAHYE